MNAAPGRVGLRLPQAPRATHPRPRPAGPSRRSEGEGEGRGGVAGTGRDGPQKGSEGASPDEGASRGQPGGKALRPSLRPSPLLQNGWHLGLGGSSGFEARRGGVASREGGEGGKTRDLPPLAGLGAGRRGAPARHRGPRPGGRPGRRGGGDFAGPRSAARRGDTLLAGGGPCAPQASKEPSTVPTACGGDSSGEFSGEGVPKAWNRSPPRGDRPAGERCSVF